MSARPPITFGLQGAGPGVVLLHGLGGDRHQALGLLPPEFPSTRLAPDMPGHGCTDLVDGEPLDFPTFASLTASLADELQHDGRWPAGPLPVVGVSMGAGIAVALADSRPDLVARLVLIRPSWLDVPEPPHLKAFSVVAQLLDTLGRGAAVFRRTPEYQRIDRLTPAMAVSLLGQFDRPHARERARVLSEMPKSVPLPDRGAYARLVADTLVVSAPMDPVHPHELATRLTACIPGARIAVVPRKMPDPTEHQLALQRVVAAELAPAMCGGD